MSLNSKWLLHRYTITQPMDPCDSSLFTFSHGAIASYRAALRKPHTLLGLNTPHPLVVDRSAELCAVTVEQVRVSSSGSISPI